MMITQLFPVDFVKVQSYLEMFQNFSNYCHFLLIADYTNNYIQATTNHLNNFPSKQINFYL